MKSSTRRLLAHGSNATVVTLLVIATLVLLYALADHFRARWDLSADARNTLSPDTVARLRLLDSDGIPVQITAFTAQEGKPEAGYKNRTVRDFLEELDRESEVVHWRQVDFDRERLTAERLGVTQYGHVVVQRGSDRVDIKDREMFRRRGKVKDNQWDFLGEAALDRALSQVMSPRRRVVYVLEGHGELDPEDQGPSGLSEFAVALDRERFDVETLDLMRTGREGEVPEVPEDAAVVFVARPLAALTPFEEDVLLAWIGRGGAVLFALEPSLPVSSIVGRLGISVPEGIVLDRQMLFPYRDRPAARYRSHPITEDLLDDNLTTVLASAAPLSRRDPLPEGVRATPILVTSRDGWIDRGGETPDGLPIYEPSLDGPGPVDMALAVELSPNSGLVRQGKPAARLVLVGDADAFTNSIFEEGPGNATFAVNTILWLAGDDRRLGVGVKRHSEAQRLTLTAEQADRLRWVSLGVMPGLIGLVGLVSWWTRRGR